MASAPRSALSRFLRCPGVPLAPSVRSAAGLGLLVPLPLPPPPEVVFEPRPLSPQLFEGMKAFKGGDRQVRLFRPWLNMDRMLRSALRLCLPVRPGLPRGGRGQAGLAGPDSGNPAQSFDKAELLECIRRLVEVDKDWVPDSAGASLYIRPVLLGNEVGRRSERGGAGRAGEGAQTPGSGRSWRPDSPFWGPSRPRSPRWVSPAPPEPSCSSSSVPWALTSRETP